MNELIERLAREAGLLELFDREPDEIEAFAKSVARECAEIADQANENTAHWHTSDKIRERFGL